jgi:hypothetical protein
MIFDQNNQNRNIQVRKMIGTKNVDLVFFWLKRISNVKTKERKEKEQLTPKMYDLQSVFFGFFMVNQRKDKGIQQQKKTDKPKGSPNSIQKGK